MLKINKEMCNHFTQSDSNFSHFFAVLRALSILIITGRVQVYDFCRHQFRSTMKKVTKARKDMSERVYKVGSIFQKNCDFDVTVRKRDAKSLERDRGDVTVGTKNRRKLN